MDTTSDLSRGRCLPPVTLQSEACWPSLHFHRPHVDTDFPFSMSLFFLISYRASLPSTGGTRFLASSFLPFSPSCGRSDEGRELIGGPDSL